VHLLVILQNTKQMPRRGPEELGRSARPEYKGKIAFTDPANSGSAYSNVTMLGAAVGQQRGRVGEGVGPDREHAVLNRSSLVFQGVGNGEFPLGMSLEYAGYQWSSNGAPVKVIYPADGTVAQMEGVAIIKGGPNTENAKQFVDYVSRKDVREMILKFAFRRPARQDLDLSKLPGAMPQLADVKLVDYDEDIWVEKRVETAQKIQDIIRRTR
jgi:iron(III) transport system substrate-binding protein